MTQDPNTWADSVIAEMDAMQGAALPGTPAWDAGMQARIQEVVGAHKAGEAQWLDSAMAEMDQYAKDPTASERALGAAKGVGRGVVLGAKQLLVDLPRSLGTAITGIEEYDAPMNQAIDRFFAPPEALQPTTLREADSPESRYGEMGGQMVPMLASLWGGPVTAMAVGGAQQAGAAGEMAREAGAGRGGIALATAGGMALGTVGGAAIEGALLRLNTQAGNAIIKAIERDALTMTPTARAAIVGASRTGIRAAEGSVAGAGLGYAYTVLSNAIHNFATDEDIPLLLGAKENVAFGAAFGGLLRGATEAALEKRRFTGRKFTANGWEGPVLDMSGMEGEVPRDWSPPERRTSSIDEFLTDSSSDPEVRRAVAEAVGAEEALRQAEAPGEPAYTTQEGNRVSTGKVDPKTGKEILEARRGTQGARETQAPEPVPYDSPERGISAPDEGYTTSRPTRVEGRTGELVEAKPPRGKPVPMPRVDEQGFAVEPSYESQPASARYQRFNAHTLTPADLQPVKDKATGRMIVNIDGRLRGTTEDTINAPRVMTRKEIVSGLIDSALVLNPELGVRVGSGTDAAGVFNDATNTMRLDDQYDFSTAAHEVGHAIENRILGTIEESPFADARRSGTVLNELTRLGKLANPGREPVNGFLSEGWAEYVRAWVLQHEDIMHHAPETTRWFDGEFLKRNPAFAERLDAARESGDIWRFQGDLKRVDAQRAKPTTALERAAEDAARNFSPRSLVKQYLALTDPARRYEEAKAAFGKPTPKFRRIDEMIERNMGVADATTKLFVTDRTVGLWGNTTGESLESAVAPMRGHQLDLERYGEVKRALWLLTERNGIDPETGEVIAAPHEMGIAEVDARGAIQKLEAKYPHIEDTMNRVRAWYERVWDYVVEADPDMKYVREEMRQAGEFYLPMRGQFEGGGGRRTGFKSAARQARMGERLGEGTLRPHKPWISQLQLEAADMFRKAHERTVINSLIENGREAGIGSLFEDVTQTFEGEGEGYKIGALVPAGELANARLDTYLSKPTMDAQGRAVFRYVEPTLGEDGNVVHKVSAFAIHPELFESLIALHPNETRLGLGWAGTLGRKFRNLQVGGHIIYNGAFGFWKNVIIDPTTAYLNAQGSHQARDLLFDWVPTLLRVAAHEFTNGRFKYEWVDAYKATRSNVGSRYESESVTTNRARDIMATPTQRVIHTLTRLDDMYEVLGRLMGVTDEAPRVWELKRAARDVGWKPGETMTEEQYHEIAIRTRRITGNRALGGTVTNKVNEIVPFFRAAFVYPRDTYRAAKADKMAFAVKAASLAAMGAMYAVLRRKNEGVDSQTPSERVRYLTFDLPDSADGAKHTLKIPVDPVAGLFLKTSEFAMDALINDDPLAAQDIVGAMAEQWMPPFIPGLAQEPMLQWANRQRFGSDAPIDKPGILPDEQFDEMTSPLAIKWGEWTGRSPRRFEHAVRNVFGAPGEFVLEHFGLPEDRKNKENTLRDVLEGNWLRRGGPVSSSSRWVDKLYDMTATAEMYARSQNRVETPEAALIRKTLVNAARATSIAYGLAKTYDLTPSQRQWLYAEANRIAKQTVLDAQEGKINPGPAMGARLQMQAQKRISDAQKGTHP